MSVNFFFKVKEVRDGPSIAYFVEQMEPPEPQCSLPIPVADSLEYNTIDAYLKATFGLHANFKEAIRTEDGEDPGTRIRVFEIPGEGEVKIQDGPRVYFSISVPSRSPSNFI